MKQFGTVWCASGARGFFGEGYWFHKYVPGLDWTGSTLVAKTTTLEPREGNMPLAGGWQPRQMFPSCIVVKPFRGVCLNAIGLSGPGARMLFGECKWQGLLEPFMLSFMPVSKTIVERLIEADQFARLLATCRDDFQSDVALQLNLSCPNTGHDLSKMVVEAEGLIRIFREYLGDEVMLIAKINLLWPVDVAAMLNVDAICIGNTVPWGAAGIDWAELFGSDVSPLAQYGGGGLSGAPLLRLVAAWIERFRLFELRKHMHINACGGIMCKRDVDIVATAGADSVSLGTIAMLRGWRVRGVIQYAREVL